MTPISTLKTNSLGGTEADLTNLLNANIHHMVLILTVLSLLLLWLCSAFCKETNKAAAENLVKIHYNHQFDWVAEIGTGLPLSGFLRRKDESVVYLNN
ncbi:uncharacterized protein CELE_F55E10.2 [Caenorhabditis elegans]|uniref:Transmembrane protein n=1 Tax=Caenorhabditis elegans TaxID=6239 RepID=Q20838_CAEEL|nr:Transmembrane protein [Caenorhabditis elegans]CCD70888.1 Transmembrane protein [Caenorhabditis elegans]|eukprot:NP_509413.1 Uncharacterized protein CELE_F55E10.2 [Caenorhabditis elegans]